MKTDDNRPEPADHDDIARLIRAAGRRPAVPADRTLRVKAALHAHWNHELGRRRRRRYVWSAAALVAAAALFMLVALPVMRPNPVLAPDMRVAGTVESFVGDCRVKEPRGDDSMEPGKLRIREDLIMGSLVTTGDSGRVALRLASGYAVMVDRGSRVRLVAPAILALDAGAIYVDSERSGRNAGTLRIQTPLGTIQEIGTRYEVRLDQGLIRVRVREGLVILDDGNRAHQIQASSEFTLNEDAAVTTRAITDEDVAWNWSEELSAVPDLKGLSAREFLEWAARERGWRLVFATERLERSASEIVLGGSAGGLTLEESLDAVLPACGMSHRVEGNALVITPVADGPTR